MRGESRVAVDALDGERRADECEGQKLAWKDILSFYHHDARARQMSAQVNQITCTRRLWELDGEARQLDS